MKPAEVSTPSDREVLVKRSFDAPVTLVWQAYTEPALMRRWLSGAPGPMLTDRVSGGVRVGLPPAGTGERPA